MIKSLFKFFISLFLFLLPWQTIWLYRSPLINGSKWEFGTLGFFATEILLWGAIILFVVWYWGIWKRTMNNKQVTVSKDRLFVLCSLLFILYCFLTLTWSPDKDLVLQQALRVMEAFLLFFVLRLGPLAWQRGLEWFLAGSLVQCLLGIGQFLTQSTFSSKWLGLVAHPAYVGGSAVVGGESIGRWLRAYGAFSHPNVLGGYLVVAMLFTVILLFFWLKNQNRAAIFLHLLFLLQTMALFFTFSRSAWIGGSIVVIIYLGGILRMGVNDRRIEKGFFFLLFFMMTFLSIIFFPLLQNRFSNTSIYEVRSVTERVDGYQEAFTLWQTAPWFGVGVGSYTAAVFQTETARSGWTLQPVHNVGLLFLTELGMVGVMFFVAVVYGAIRVFYVSSGKKYLLFLAPFISLLLFDHYLWSSYTGLMLSAVFLAVSTQIFPSSSTGDGEKGETALK